MTITDNPATCECRRRPWITLDMLGKPYTPCGDGIQRVRCLDSDHCLRGAPIIDGRLGEHWRNMDHPACPWTGIRVRESTPCKCGGWPWIRTETLKLVFHDNISLLTPIRKVGCPGCRGRLVEVTKSRINVHTRHVNEPCAWSGVYVAVGEQVPPTGISAPVPPRV